MYAAVGGGAPLEALSLRPGRETRAVSCGTATFQHEGGLYADVGGSALLEEGARDGDGLERLVARLRPHHLQRRAVDARARLRRNLQGGMREMGYYDDASVLRLSALRRRRGCGEWAWRWARWVMAGGRRHLHRDVARPRGGAHLGQVVPSIKRGGRAEREGGAGE